MHDLFGPRALRGFAATCRSSEMAAGLLDVVNESELEDFVRGLVAETARNADGRIPVGAARALVAALTKTAERTLPTLTVALGDGSRPAAVHAEQTAARIFGVEPEGMSAEDRDFEIARQFVSFAQAETVRSGARVNSGEPADHHRDQHGRSDMFEQTAEYGNGGPPPQREGGWAGEEEYPGYQGEQEYPGYQGEQEYPGYQGEEEYPGYHHEQEYPGYQGEEEYPGSGEAEEEQFLPALIPIVGQVLGGLLGGLKREAESGGYGQGEEEYPLGEAGEAEEQFLHKILLGALGKEAQYHASPLSGEQEDEFAGRLLEVSDEEELGRVLGGIVNTVGRVVQGVRGAVNSPQGRTIIDAVAPLADAALAGEGAGSVMEAESGGLNQEEGQFEAARRVVQLALGRGPERRHGTAGRAATARRRGSR